MQSYLAAQCSYTTTALGETDLDFKCNVLDENRTMLASRSWTL